MRYVKFIKRLVIDKLPMISGDEIRYHTSHDLPPMIDGEMLLVKEPVITHIVPIHRLCKATRDNRTGENHIDTIYIAYSKEVQELLEMPFDVIKSELETCRVLSHTQAIRLNRVRYATVWIRIKYLFKQENFR